MLTPAQLEAIPYELQQLVDQLEDDILESMAQRLVQADFDKEAFAWEMQKAQELTKTREDIVKILSRKTGVMERTIEEILKFAAVESLSFDAAIYSLAGLNPLPVVRSPGMQQLLRAGIENTQGVMRNWTRTTANTATKQFEDAMDRAYMQVLSGAFSPGTAVSRAVSKLAKDGIQAVRYPSGHVDHMDVAARRAVRTGIAQTTGKLQEQIANELGCDLMQITSHMGARPSHAVWQGRIVCRSGRAAGYLSLDDIGYGTGAGFKGWNCRHDWYPYIEGLSFSTAEIYALDENREVYEATQKQRALERKVRASKRACVADSAALDGCICSGICSGKDAETKAKLAEQLERDAAQLKKRREELKVFVESYRSPTGGQLARYAYREKAEGFDRAMARKMREISGKTLISDSRSDIMKLGRDIVSIKSPIEQRHTGKGNPNAILQFGAQLTQRQYKLNLMLPSYDSRVIVKKKEVNMADLSALTAETGVEYALFTKGNQRLIIRGDAKSVNINLLQAKQLTSEGYRWSGHTHPGTDDFCLSSSDGDLAVLAVFGQKRSVIYNSKGRFSVFDRE